MVFKAATASETVWKYVGNSILKYSTSPTRQITNRTCAILDCPGNAGLQPQWSRTLFQIQHIATEARLRPTHSKHRYVSAFSSMYCMHPMRDAMQTTTVVVNVTTYACTIHIIRHR